MVLKKQVILAFPSRMLMIIDYFSCIVAMLRPDVWACEKVVLQWAAADTNGEVCSYGSPDTSKQSV